MESRFEAMRQDHRHWRLGAIYDCPADPRVVVRNRSGVGWAWNFGHPMVLPAIALAITLFWLPASVAVWLGVRSRFVLAATLFVSLLAIVWAASVLAKDPEAER